MEFKFDEAEAFRVALHALGRAEPGVGSFFPAHGLIFSIGLKAPPGFVYALAVPMAIVRTPLSAAVFVALSNVLAVWLSYVAGRRFFSEAVGLMAAALFAASPWAVVFSRKLWSPDLLPICTGVFLVALHACVVNKRPAALFWAILSLAVATQLHPSAWLLVVVLAVALWKSRPPVEWRYVVLGVTTVAILYAPYLWDVASNGLFAYRENDAMSSSPRFLTSGRDMLAVGAADQMDALLGSQWGLALPFSIGFGICSLVGLGAACAARSSTIPIGLRWALPTWYLLPFIALSVSSVASHVYYFIILYPLPFLGVAVVLNSLAHYRRLVSLLVLAGILGVFSIIDGKAVRTITRQGGTPAEYGVAYTFKQQLVESLVAENRGRRFELSSARRGDGGVAEYRVLEWNERGARDTELRPAVWRYVISTEFGSRPSSACSNVNCFGPLRVTRVRVAVG